MALTVDRTPAVELDRDALVRKIDDEARARVGMSAEALLKAHHSGTLEEPGRVGDLIVLADLLARDDPLLR